MKTINVTTKQLFDNFISNLADMVWDEPAFADGYQTNNLKVVAEENMEAIRGMFKDGMTHALLSMADMEAIDKDYDTGEQWEVRVFDQEHKLIGVVIDSEIVY
jgi:hypothetical protein